jgi:hypothetical protein
MLKLRQMERDILANGRVDSRELETLRQELYAAGTVASFLCGEERGKMRLSPPFVLN